MMAEEDGVTIATFRKVSPLDYVRGPTKERSPEDEAEDAARRIIKEVNKLRREREKNLLPKAK
jgi:hypothetical protein